MTKDEARAEYKRLEAEARRIVESRTKALLECKANGLPTEGVFDQFPIIPILTKMVNLVMIADGLEVKN